MEFHKNLDYVIDFYQSLVSVLNIFLKNHELYDISDLPLMT